MSVAGAQLGIMEGSSYITSGILICMLAFTLLRVWKGSRVDFLLILVIMLLLSNVFFICYIAAYNNRKNLVQDPNSTRLQVLPIVSFSIACDFIRYLTLQISMWLFTFKYWVVSVEVPKAI
jgi:hypothetical protein